ncbi:TPA: glycosyltransferase family 2 protein [Candidatus Avigastranaerophilus faecigallinarum]|nr:glycosyltransferase family 2 protein [Candidatus Avigastranaerophilus faecigallinarum]
MKSPKVSLILIYDKQDNLKECLNSLIMQSFKDIEIICINNASKDEAENIVKELSLNEERIKLICMPMPEDNISAKKIALGVAGGDFVCFVNSCEIYDTDFVRELYLKSIEENLINTKENHFYRRSFLENDEEIAQIINDKVNQEIQKYKSVIDNQNDSIKNEFNKFYQNNVETIKNNSYEILCRFNQLEKVFYDRDYQNQIKNNELINEVSSKNQDLTKQIYDDIAKVYDYINSEINKKGMEINRVYDEISKNYQYTEKLVFDKNNETSSIINNGKDDIWNKISELEKEIIVRYVNLKRLLDIQIDEVDSKLKALNNGSLSEYKVIDIEKTVTESIDKMYEHMNNISSIFYEELTKIYKEMNEKLCQKSEENKYFLEQKITELRNEFDEKLKNLKKEITG